MQLHVMEIKANDPFSSPVVFEETVHSAVETLSEFLRKRFNAHLLGTGMHPLMKLDETSVWPHRHKKIYASYGRIFNLKQHGWLNIQSFHLNLPFQKERDAVLQLNILANLCPYLPAIAASSPIYEGTLHGNSDNRLAFYKINQIEVPSVSGDIVPEYVSSTKDYRQNILDKFSQDLAKKGASKILLCKEWVNSRGVILRFDRKALEIRVMDEQECVKADVALSCYVRATLRGMISNEIQLLPHETLVADFNSILAEGLDARVLNPKGPSARDVCRHFFNIAWSNATQEEKQYLPLIKKRIEEGNLSDIIRRRVMKRASHSDLTEAITNVYSTLINCLATNQPYF